MEYKPFDLEAALAGKPVRLRNGSKAYVKYEMPEEYTGEFLLRGFIITNECSTGVCDYSWIINGQSFEDGKEYPRDIIGMWEEPRPRVQLDLPAPLKEPQEEMWYITDSAIKSLKFDMNYKEHPQLQLLFNSRTYFAKAKDAQEWLEALKGARR